MFHDAKVILFFELSSGINKKLILRIDFYLNIQSPKQVSRFTGVLFYNVKWAVMTYKWKFSKLLISNKRLKYT